MDESEATRIADRGREGDNLLSLYHRYVESNTEAPKLFHTWSAICGMAAILGKNVFVKRGHYNIYPNFYVMLIGSPGTGKGTSINILQKILVEAGYRTFAADKSSKEKFLLDFQEGFSFEEASYENAKSVFNLSDFLAEEKEEGQATEVFVVAEEFNDFVGSNNIEFVSLLTKLWSFNSPPAYAHRLKNSKSVSIWDPCVNILGGNTSQGFAMAFPPEIMGQGFLARLLPIYGEPTGKKITFPHPPDASLGTRIAEAYKTVRRELKGEMIVSPEGKKLLERIHQEWKPMSDGRFQHYTHRRITHLFKLCMIFAAFRSSLEISIKDIKDANTLLSHTENLMPKAIGEFGKARHSDVVSKIMESLYMATKPLTTQDIWKLCSSDLNSITELAPILQGLAHADKIQMVQVGKQNGWLPKQIVHKQETDFTSDEMQDKLSSF